MPRPEKRHVNCRKLAEDHGRHEPEGTILVSLRASKGAGLEEGPAVSATISGIQLAAMKSGMFALAVTSGIACQSIL